MKFFLRSLTLSCALSSLAQAAELSKPNSVAVVLSAIGNNISQSLPTSSSTQKTSFWFGIGSLVGAGFILLPIWAEKQQKKLDGLFKKALKSNAPLPKVNALLNLSSDVQKTVNKQSSTSKITPLIYAAHNGNVEIVKLLIDKKAALDDRDAHGNTAFMHAVQKSHGECLLLLACKGADIALRNDAGVVPIDYAKNKLRILRLFSPAGIYVQNPKIQSYIQALQEYEKLLKSIIREFFYENRSINNGPCTHCVLTFLTGDQQEIMKPTQIRDYSDEKETAEQAKAAKRWDNI